MDINLTTRLVAAYQFIAQSRGEEVALASVRLFLVGPHTVEAHELNPLLRRLNGTVVDFFGEGGQGTLSLHEPAEDTPWDELDGGVEVDGVLYTHMAVRPCG
jgi:hypothetical protein